MKYALITLTLFGALSFSCLNGTKPSAEERISEQSNSSINESGNSIDSYVQQGIQEYLQNPPHSSLTLEIYR